ncbi:MAG: hypothetical protein ACT4PO_01505 [Actinomycetota bacterium]
MWEAGFETYAGAAFWEAQARGGQDITHWGVEGAGWNGRVFSRCGTPTRAVLQVAPREEVPLSTLVGYVQDAVAGIRSHLPGARIELIPVNGGTDNAICPSPPGFGDGTVYSSRIHPLVEQAIAAVAQSPGYADTFAGPDVEHPCSMYADNRGHMTVEGAVFVASKVGGFYAGTSG